MGKVGRNAERRGFTARFSGVLINLIKGDMTRTNKLRVLMCCAHIDKSMGLMFALFVHRGLKPEIELALFAGTSTLGAYLFLRVARQPGGKPFLAQWPGRSHSWEQDHVFCVAPCKGSSSDRRSLDL